MRRDLAVALACAVLSVAALAGDGGTVCLAPLQEGARAADHDSPDGKAGREYAYRFTVQIDSRPPVAVTEGMSPTAVKDLDTSTKHRVVIRDEDRVIETFSFTFQGRGSLYLCLWYKTGYQTWSLTPYQSGRTWCQCAR